MTLDEFIVLQKINLEKFRIEQIRGVINFEWPTDRQFLDWEKQYQEWAEFNTRKDSDDL